MHAVSTMQCISRDRAGNGTTSYPLDHRISFLVASGAQHHGNPCSAGRHKLLCDQMLDWKAADWKAAEHVDRPQLLPALV